MIIRPTEPTDIEPLLEILLTSNQFDEPGLEYVHKTLEHYFSGTSEDLWFSAELQQGLIGIAYCAPEVMTTGTWNLLMLWITPSQQRHGVGRALITHVEKELKNKHGRLLLVETSSSADFSTARAFYSKQGFVEEARVRDYYSAKQDKLIYTKHIA